MNILLAIDESAGLRVLKHLARGPHRVVGALVPSVSARSEGIHALAERWRVPVYPGRAARDPEVIEFLRLSPAERPVAGVPGSVVISDGTVVVSARDRSLRVELIRIGTERRNPADVFSSGDRLTSS